MKNVKKFIYLLKSLICIFRNRLVKVEDDKVRGGIVSMLQYMANEFNELQGTDDS